MKLHEYTGNHGRGVFAWGGKACENAQMSKKRSLCQRKTDGGLEKGLANLWSRKKIKKKFHVGRGQITKWEMSNEAKNPERQNKMKSTITKQFGLCALLMALCIGWSGCVLPSSSTLATPKGEFRLHGTIAAVNTADRTIEIKTDEGESLVVSVLETTKLWQTGRHFTFDQMETGKYVVIQCSKSPEGKFIASRVVMYNDKSKAATHPTIIF
jgi:hypothetical protein